MAASSASSPIQSLFSQTETLVGTYISILTRSEVRYEGICYSVDSLSKPPSIFLAYVKDCGTEGRRGYKGWPEIPPKDYMVDHMIFPANNIVGIKVLGMPKRNTPDHSYDLSAQEYHQMLRHLSTLNFMSATSVSPSLDARRYHHLSQPMANSNLNPMARPFGFHDADASVGGPANKQKSVINVVPPIEFEGKYMRIEAPTGKGKSILCETRMEDPAGSINMHRQQTIGNLQAEDAMILASDPFYQDLERSIKEPMITLRRTNITEPMQEASFSLEKKTRDTIVLPADPFDQGLGRNIEAPMIILPRTNAEPVHEPCLPSENKMIGRSNQGATASSSILRRGNVFWK